MSAEIKYSRPFLVPFYGYEKDWRPFQPKWEDEDVLSSSRALFGYIHFPESCNVSLSYVQYKVFICVTSPKGDKIAKVFWRDVEEGYACEVKFLGLRERAIIQKNLHHFLLKNRLSEYSLKRTLTN